MFHHRDEPMAMPMDDYSPPDAAMPRRARRSFYGAKSVVICAASLPARSASVKPARAE